MPQLFLVDQLTTIGQNVKNKKMNSKNFFQTTGGIVLSLGILYASVWVISKAWEKGQEQKAK